MATIPDAFRDLFDKPTFAYFAVLTEDGFPHVTPVWIGYDRSENRLLVNTERGRRKEQNVRDDPRVGVAMTDPDNPYRALTVIGSVDQITEDGAREHIDLLAQRYTGEDYGYEIQTARVLVKIRPEEVIPHGG